jgi:hypothetical protein
MLEPETFGQFDGVVWKPAITDAGRRGKKGTCQIASV